MSHFKGHFEGAKRDNLGFKKVEAPSKCPEKWLIKLLSHKKKIRSQSFLTRIPSGESIWGSRSKKDRLLKNQ
jgi:hypothetical protein